jgi:PAS domain S-box-containing protein
MLGQPAPTVLFVDDDQVTRQLLGCLFRDAGFTTLEVGTGSEALTLAQTRHPDLIVLDVNLPDLNGYEVCRQLKAHPDTRDTTVLQMSAVYVGSGDRSQGLEGGADAYLVKPVEPREILATVRALLRMRKAEEAARTAAQQWRATFDAISDAVCLLCTEGRIVRCNRAFRDLCGRSFQELIGQDYTRMLQEAFHLDSPLALDGLAPPGVFDSRELNLGRRSFRHKADPILDDRGARTGTVHILTDLTSQKELEEQLRQAQKLEAIGRLAGGIAHDFNNLLTAILGNASLLQQSLPRQEAEHELASIIERAAWRAADLTRQLLGFSRQTLLWLKVINLNEPVREAVGTLQKSMPANVRLAVRGGEALWPVHADPMQITQVLGNLCRNALDAMPEGGSLTIETANVQVEEAQTQVNPEARLGPFVRLSVSDTGPGITAEVLPRIFDPFFTTKTVGKGSGLGLAMVHGIIKQHQGWVECKSVPGQGARFDLYLPRTDMNQPAPVRSAQVGLQ